MRYPIDEKCVLLFFPTCTNFLLFTSSQVIMPLRGMRIFLRAHLKKTKICFFQKGSQMSKVKEGTCSYGVDSVAKDNMVTTLFWVKNFCTREKNFFWKPVGFFGLKQQILKNIQYYYFGRACSKISKISNLLFFDHKFSNFWKFWFVWPILKIIWHSRV